MKILVIDDSSTQRVFLNGYLGRMGHEVLLAEGGRQGVELFASSDPDLVLLDVMMPDLDGYEAARMIRGIGGQWVPIIFVSGRNKTGDIEEGIDAGGDDYLTKPFDPRVLEAKIRSMARIVQMRRELVLRGEELKAANAALMQMVDVDGLTGIANRRRLDRTLEDEVGRAARGGTALALILADIDHFKQFNDSHGHLAGDECLRQVARVLEKQVLRPADLAARYGGEEFCMVLPETDIEDAVRVAERLRARIRATTIVVAQGTVRVTASFGVAAAVPSAHAMPAEWLAAADAALYAAKQAGRDCVLASQFLAMPGPHAAAARGQSHVA